MFDPQQINRQHTSKLVDSVISIFWHLQELKDLNVYNILAPCYHHPKIQEAVFRHSSLPESFRRLGETERSFPVRKTMAGRSWPMRATMRNGPVPMWTGIGGRSLNCTVRKLGLLHIFLLRCKLAVRQFLSEQ
jgi:hypothetical protein